MQTENRPPVEHPAALTAEQEQSLLADLEITWQLIVSAHHRQDFPEVRNLLRLRAQIVSRLRRTHVAEEVAAAEKEQLALFRSAAGGRR